MRIINWDQFIKTGLNPPASGSKEKKSSITVGVFDGVHLGHQALIKQVVSHNADYTPVVVTFRQNHKTKEMKNEETSDQKDILNFQQKVKIFEKLGIKITIVIDFTEEFKKMPGIEFLKILSERGNPGFFAVGRNFRCGFQLDTNAAAIEKFFVSRDIPIEILPEIMEGSLPVSSSRIRSAINNGDHTFAEIMLGRKWRNN